MNTSFNITNIESIDRGVPVSLIIHISAQVLLFCVGLLIQLKIIFVCNKDKDGKTWQIHMTHSIVTIIYFSFNVIFQTFTHFIPFLSQHTGDWFCYLAAFVELFCFYSLSTNSLLIAVMKFVFIVHNNKVLEFGEDRTKITFFLINLALPLLLTTSDIVTENWDYFGDLTSCFGQSEQELAQHNISRGWLEKFFLCNTKHPNINDSDVLFVIKQCVCAVVSTVAFVISTNIPEAFFYYKIFQKMNW